jgi:hypothetical protein
VAARLELSQTLALARDFFVSDVFDQATLGNANVLPAAMLVPRSAQHDAVDKRDHGFAWPGGRDLARVLDLGEPTACGLAVPAIRRHDRLRPDEHTLGSLIHAARGQTGPHCIVIFDIKGGGKAACGLESHDDCTIEPAVPAEAVITPLGSVEDAAETCVCSK